MAASPVAIAALIADIVTILTGVTLVIVYVRKTGIQKGEHDSAMAGLTDRVVKVEEGFETMRDINMKAVEQSCTENDKSTAVLIERVNSLLDSVKDVKDTTAQTQALLIDHIRVTNGGGHH